MFFSSHSSTNVGWLSMYVFLILKKVGISGGACDRLPRLGKHLTLTLLLYLAPIKVAEGEVPRAVVRHKGGKVQGMY